MKPKSGFYVGAIAAFTIASPAMAMESSMEPSILANDEQPGSVLVWPKFVAGSVVVDQGTAEQFTAAKTVIRMTTLCPVGGLNPTCGADATVFVHFHWICPPLVGNICTATDFIVPATYGAGHADAITFNPSGIPSPAGTDVNGNINVAIVDPVHCPRGYLIAWAVDPTDRPIKFDGLIGDAQLRSTGGADFGLESYKAVAIQADPTAALNAVLDTRTGLVFDGRPGHYQAVTGQLQGPVNFDRQINPPFSYNALVLLTLDINEGLANNPTFVPLDFFTHINEARLSTETMFTCWEQVSFTVEPTNMLNPNLTAEIFGSDFGAGLPQSNGVLFTGQAMDAVTQVPRTLLGFFLHGETLSPGKNDVKRGVFGALGNNSVPIPTTFKFQP